MHFVDPGDLSLPDATTTTNDGQQRVAIATCKDFPEPPNKRLKLHPPPADNNSDFFTLINSENDDISCENNTFKLPARNDNGIRNRSRSFSGNVPPTLSRQRALTNLGDKSVRKVSGGLQRARSFSEACSREDFAPFGNFKFNTSLTSLLEAPEDLPISSNPIFNELKSTLLSDCHNTSCPEALFDTLSSGSSHDVYSRERQLQTQFSTMQSRYPDEIRELSNFYHQQSSEIETERLKEIHDEHTPTSYRNYLNNYYDHQLHLIMDRVEKSLRILSDTKKDVMPGFRAMKTRPLLSRKAVAMMEEWYSRNFEHPYPSNTAVEALAKAGEITTEQVKKWFANKRNRSKNSKSMREVANMRRKRQFSARW